ncbi:MAG: hypothetical protein LLG40_06515 [Deltaproteobacteria bacterium]|nr:hypothetical protein [Deltaproteobacteria bacterium]
MSSDKQYCAICAWKVSCQKRFNVPTDSRGCVRCPDYSRDLSVKDSEIEEAVKKDRQA